MLHAGNAFAGRNFTRRYYIEGVLECQGQRRVGERAKAESKNIRQPRDAKKGHGERPRSEKQVRLLLGSKEEGSAQMDVKSEVENDVPRSLDISDGLSYVPPYQISVNEGVPIQICQAFNPFGNRLGCRVFSLPVFYKLGHLWIDVIHEIGRASCRERV